MFYSLIFALLLFLSAFFSGSETAFFSLPASTLDRYKNSDLANELRVSRLMSTPRQLLITILIGNTMVNIAIASLAVVLTTRLSENLHLSHNLVVFLDVVAVTFVILIVSEILPKVTAVRNAERFSRFASLPLSLFFYLLYPITYALTSFTKFFQKRLGFTEDKALLSEEELKTLADVGEEKGTLQKDEREMIHSIFEFSETTVKEIMVPRTDMVLVDTETTLTQLMELVKTKLHSRIPVYKGRIENIIGILYVKDLIPFISKRKREKLNLEKLARPAYFVPEQKKIDELLREFQDEHIHMALVVDEYGGISGLVTLEDIIEEIVGEIQDEYDKEAPLYKQLDENTFQIDGKMSLEEINEELALNLPEEEGIETISGFILNLLGSLPKENEVVRWKNYRLTVEKINKNRILKVRLEILDQAAETGSEA
ncbi:MAG: hemolysin family protein [Calditrichia bacterium]